MARKVQIMVATESGSAVVGKGKDAHDETFVKGTTRFAADHPVVKAHPQFFAPVEEGAYGVETTEAKPGEPRTSKG